MAQHGRTLAANHRIDQGRAPERLQARVVEDAAFIVQACSDLSTALRAGREIPPAAQCLLDHAHLVDEQVRLVRRHLTPGDIRQLPRLANPEAACLPRVYQLALDIVAHSDGRIDQDSLSAFFAAYQETQLLQLGELRAIPFMLRIALVDSLRQIAERSVRSMAHRELASHWAGRMTEEGALPPDIILLVADMARSEPPLTPAFVAGLARKLQWHGAALAMQWLAGRVAEQGLTIEQMVQADISNQAADQVSAANAADSLRKLGSIDWDGFAESLSAIHRELLLDPDGTYQRMDMPTRALYRRAVEGLARKSRRPELEVAQAALSLAREPRAPSAGGLDPRTRHVGHYLVGEGAQELEQRLGIARSRLARRFGRAQGDARLFAFLVAFFTFTALFTAAAVDRALDSALDEVLAALFTLLFAVGASQLAVALVNFIAAQLTRPHLLPRLDFDGGVPDDAQALVVVPAMLYTADDVHALCDALEVRFLANRDPNLRFCLLTDYADADAQHLPGDAELLELAHARIEALNRRHASERTVTACHEDGHELSHTGTVQPFLLLHRPRSWNAREGVWMGHERKRGKLAALNAFLRGGARDSFAMVAGGVERLHEIRFVITLDPDTVLPRGAARKLVATMAHPLNQAQVARDGDRVVSGYGMLQPRMEVSLPREPVSRYAELCGAGPAIDPSGRTVPEVYQDLFAEGASAGKAIYDVDAWQRVLGDRIPGDVVLSHDLLEGCYLRVGVLQDQQLFEPCPARYSADISRRHRCIRGDWQVAGWLRRAVPGPGGTRLPNPLTALSRWKLFDKLRASLVAPAFTALLVLSWTVLPVDWFWTAAVMAAIFVPPLLSVLFQMVEKPRGVPWPQHWSNVWHTAAMSIGHAGLSLVFLPYEAFMHLDAILRTGWRMLVSRRRLLEWRPAVLSRSSTNLQSNARNMWFAPLLAVVCAVALQLSNPQALLLAGPFLLAWLLSPLVAWWASLPLPRAAAKLAVADLRFLRKLARRNWSLFDAFVTPQSHWLPPDKLQEQPEQAVVARTSPANVGMSLLSNLAAWDLGYITTGQLAARCEGTLATVAGMERFRGHLFNAYDLLTLAPLSPRCVSTAESGNLAGHLLTLAMGLEQAVDAALVDARALQGIATALDIVEEHAAAATTGLRDAITAMRKELGRGSASAGSHTLPGFADRLSYLCRHAGDIVTAAAGGDPQLAAWSARLQAQCVGFMEELSALAPWAARADQYVLDSRLTRVPTLRELAGYTVPEGRGIGDGRSAGLPALVEQGRAAAAARIAQLETLARDARAAARMDFTWLFDDSSRTLFAGYNVSERRMDKALCDLLASDARLASFVAISQDQLPAEHWYALGRQQCYSGGEQMLQSPSGSLSDYLMPLLAMPSYRGTLLDHAARAAVRSQALSGRRHGVPWGTATSGTGDSVVVTPYASVMGLMAEPELALRNLQRMAGRGFIGEYGFYEAVDWGRAEAGRGRKPVVRHSYAMQQQGASLVALDHLLSGQPMQRRFEAAPALRATLPALQERVPRGGAFPAASPEIAHGRTAQHESAPLRTVDRTVTPRPQVQLLSNGSWHVMISSAGGGYSRWRDSAVTRWRRDATRDNWGSFCYVRDVGSGAFWSTTYQPTLVEPQRYEAVFSESRAIFRRHDAGIDLHTEVAVAQEDDVELRRTRMVNHSGVRRVLELTSYVELAAPQPGAAACVEILHSHGAVLYMPGAKEDELPGPCVLHLAHVLHGTHGAVSFATSREAFVGRDGDTVSPRAVREGGPLGGASGTVRDPVLAIRCEVILEPGESAVVAFVTGAVRERAAALHLAGKYRDRSMAGRAFAMAEAHAPCMLRQLDAGDAAAQVYAALAGAIIYPHATLRGDLSALRNNQRGPSGLKAYGVSGGLPIVLLVLRGHDGMDLARDMLRAHAYWGLKGLSVDLVIWCPDDGAAGDDLCEQILGLAATAVRRAGRGGAVVVRATEDMPPEDRVLMMAAASVVIDQAAGPLASQVARASAVVNREVPLAPGPDRGARPRSDTEPALPELRMFDGTGGFTMDGREYVIRLPTAEGTPPQRPNVLANPSFGSSVSESGAATTWSGNSHCFNLTPWHDESAGEAFYIRDEQSGEFWSPGAQPAGGNGGYLARHGFGYSVFEHGHDSIRSEMTTFVAPDAPLKYTVIRVRNDGRRLRRLSVTGYVEWVLGATRETGAMHIVTELDDTSGALFARNGFSEEAGGRVGFFHVNAQIRTVTGDRAEFIGRNRSLADPAAMQLRRLSGKVGPALDPCAAFCAPFALRPGEERELVFVLGLGGRRSADTAHVVETCGGSDAARRTLDKVHEHWEAVLGTLQVTTPDPLLDLMTNGWLLYQACSGGRWTPAMEQLEGSRLAHLREMLEERERHPAPADADADAATRAAIRSAMAIAQDGDPERAWELQRQVNPGGRLVGDGAAGWMYLLIVESLLGVTLQDDALTVAPLLPADWPGFTVRYRHGASLYLIDVRGAEQSSLELDGVQVPASIIMLEDDAAEHRVEVRIRRERAAHR